MSPACSSPAATRSAARRAAATRRGRSHSTSIGHFSVVSSCLGPNRKEERKHGILQQARLEQVGPREPHLGKLHLEVGVVPERNRHRFFLREPVVNDDARRNGGTLDIRRPLRDAGKLDEV